MAEPRFDVAISFLARDEPLALELRARLAAELDTFIYSKQQEQVAGSEGLESLREAFRAASRLVVVLYRDGWGNTPWTGEERGLRLIHEVEMHRDLVFTFDYRQGVGWCWVSERDCRSTAELADHLVSEFVFFAEQVERGQLVGSEQD